MTSRLFALLTVVLVLLMPCKTLFATSSYLNQARLRYPRIASTRLDSCSLCHTTAPALGAYGQAYRSAGRNFATIEALDSDGDRFTNLAEINALTFPGDSKDFIQTSLIFPTTVNVPAHTTGFAITNAGSTSATVVLSLYQNSGQVPASGASVSSYKVLTMPARSQTANMAFELFGSGLQLDGGWVRLASAQPGIAGFFLDFDDRLTVLDGTDAAASAEGSLILPEARNASISLVNPDETRAATAELQLIDNQGQLQGAATVQIPANGRYAGRVDALFSASALAAGGYVRVNAVPGVVASEFVGPTSGEFSALRGLDPAGGARQLFSPQFAAGGGTWKSSMAILNLENSPTNLTLSFIGDSGNEIGRTVSFDLTANGRTVIPDPSIFGLPAVPDSLLQGYVRIVSSATRIAGFVAFGDPADARFQTALPCVTQAGANQIFSQVAVDGTWFTGVAVINNNGVPVEMTVSVYRTNGTLAGSGKETLAPNARFSKLLTELVSGLPALNKGYFTVSATQPVFSFAVFGTQSLSVLSAIPPQ